MLSVPPLFILLLTILACTNALDPFRLDKMRSTDSTLSKPSIKNPDQEPIVHAERDDWADATRDDLEDVSRWLDSLNLDDTTTTTTTTSTAPLTSSTLTARPLIGVVAIPGGPAPDGWAYIAASYVKFLEQGGARVAPIFFDEPRDSLEAKLRAVNGLLIPGGVDIEFDDQGPGTQLWETAQIIFEMAVKFNRDGSYFPVHGVGIGMEMMMRYFSENTIKFRAIDSTDFPTPLTFEGTVVKSRFFESFKMSMLQYMSEKPAAWHTHKRGVKLSDFVDNERLIDLFMVLTRSTDRRGHKYVSTIESDKYPFTATQWHPEKNSYEWAPSKRIPHNSKSILVSQYVSNYIVDELRRSGHRPDPDQEEDLLIYNYNANYTGRTGGRQGKEDMFEQVYFFKPRRDREEEEDEKRRGGAR